MKINIEDVIKIVHLTKPLLFDRSAAGRVTVKGQADFVTEVDFRIQELLRGELRKRYPEASLLSEEQDNASLAPSRPIWILDPVDGTMNLVHHFHHSAVSLGLYEEGRITAGVIYQPFTGETFHAVRGKGAYLNGEPIRVSEARNLGESMLAIGTNPYHKETAAQNFRIFERVFCQCEDIRRSGSAALDLAYVACGRLDAYFEQNLKPWDYAAGAVILEEAGGAVTGYRGERLTFLEPADILAGNGRINAALQKELLA